MYRLQHYLDMMSDPHRMAPLDAAIRSVVRPGDVVLDLGAGTGVLSFIALDAGAAHVYAVERSPVIEVARRVARANGLADRITFIQADARSVVAPHRVDGLVGDIRGTLPLLGDNVDLFRLVRERWLKPGGYTIPIADEILVAPVSAAKPHDLVDGWNHQRREAHYEAAAELAANGFLRASFEAAEVLADSQIVGSVCYDRETSRTLALQTSFVVTLPATMTGLGLWFRGILTRDISFDTSPSSPVTIYAQGFLPLSRRRPVVAGETINVRVAVHRTPSDPVWVWNVASERAGWQENHSTFSGTLLSLSGIDWLTGAKKPALSEEGLLARQVLGSVDGKATARELATQLASAFPERFATSDDAMPVVTKLLGRYASP